jgi:hypothetical protein
MTIAPPFRSRRGNPHLYLTASADDERPHEGVPPVRLTNAPLLFATTLSIALGITLAGAARGKPQGDTDPSPDAPPSSTEPASQRMMQPPAW